MSSLSILVVDDDRDNADSLAELFEMEGHEVAVAYSGFDAIAAYEKRDFDIAFMDVMMPGMNGVESFLAIKRLKPKCRVFMMTGYTVEQLLQQAVENGALGVFTKPVDINQVLKAIEKVQAIGIVLVAEDDPDFGPELLECIEASGRKCELVTDGKTALERVAKGGVEVLILDLNMPLISGIEVYKTLDRAGKALPTVMITGCPSAYEDELDALRDVELTGVLNKPFQPELLLDKLKRLAG